MKRKLKFITSVALLSLSVFGLVMGVYALVQRQISIGGTVSFSASTVRADYLVEKTIAYTGETPPAFDTVGSGSFNVNMQDNATADLGNIMLSDNAEKFAYRVTITSTEAVRDLIVSYTVPTLTQTWLSVYVNDVLSPTETTDTITSGQEMVYTFVIVADGATAPENATDIEVGTNFSISLTEQDEEMETIARTQRRLFREQQQNEQINNTTANHEQINNSMENVNHEQMHNSMENVNHEQMQNTTANHEHTNNSMENMGSDTMGTI